MILIARPRPISDPLALGCVLRGGGWFSKDRNCRSAASNWSESVSRNLNYGFRLILRKKSDSNTRREKQ